MEPRVRHIAVGAFVLAFSAAFLLILLWIVTDDTGGQTSTYRIQFPNAVTGLASGVGVRYLGLPVGRVGPVRIAPDDPTKIEAVIEVQADTPIRSDTTAKLETAGLTGGVFIQLSASDAGAPPIQDAPDGGPPLIPSTRGGLSAVVERAPEIAAATGRLIANLERITGDGTQANIDQTLADVAAAAAALRLVAEDAGANVAAAGEAAREIAALARDLRDLSTDIRVFVDRVSGDAEAAMATASAAAGAMAAAAREAETTMAAIGPPAARFAETGLPEAARLATDARELVRTLNRLADRLERDPSRFLFGDNQGGFETR